MGVVYFANTRCCYYKTFTFRDIDVFSLFLKSSQLKSQNEPAEPLTCDRPEAFS